MQWPTAQCGILEEDCHHGGEGLIVASLADIKQFK